MTTVLKRAVLAATTVFQVAFNVSCTRAGQVMPAGSPSAVNQPAVFLDPAPGETIRDRRAFPVTGSVVDYNEAIADHWHYWVSLADGSMLEHWPKFYVKSAQFSGEIYDRSENPYPERQPMMILLLRVDDATSQMFGRWLRQPPWPPIRVDPSQVVARVPIMFP